MSQSPLNFLPVKRPLLAWPDRATQTVTAVSVVSMQGVRKIQKLDSIQVDGQFHSSDATENNTKGSNSVL